MSDNLIVDLFCGCGGFSLGAHLAGFETALAVDVDPTLSGAFKLNFPAARVWKFDLAKTSPGKLRDLVGFNRLAGVIAGPPCQGFSFIGKRQQDDPRNDLVRHCLKLVAGLEPKFFAVENVPGILLGDARRRLDEALELVAHRYEVLEPTVSDAADFGAATRRPRVLVIGYDPNCLDPLTVEDILGAGNAEPATVRETIADLPGPAAGERDEHGFEWVEYPDPEGAPVGGFAARARAAPPEGLGWNVANTMLSCGRVSGVMPTAHADAVARRFDQTPPGNKEPISKFPRLDWNGQCPTLRAGTGADRGRYQSVRPIHPEEPRVVTVREAARLQGFPDWFAFHPTKWHSFRMIGNSVSPLLARGVLELIASRMRISGRAERQAAPAAA